MLMNQYVSLVRPHSAESGGSQYAVENKKRLLAEAFPAMTLAAGRTKVNALGIFGRNFDMQSQFKTEVNKMPIWPSERLLIKDKRWRHNDIREVSYLYVHELFNEFVKVGGLK